MAGEQLGGGKKRGRPRKMPTDSPGGASTARSAQQAAVRRSGRQRRPRRARDFADYGDEDDDFYWWEVSSDEDAKKKAEDDPMANEDVEPRKFRLLQKLPPQSDGSGGSGREEEDEVRGRDYMQECDEPASGSTPLPDKKTLDSILDRLQKKDIYGVYAEPVDPEELPDYHDIIKHPMDFKTIRKKVADGCYSDLEKFESDVFLLCTNSMEYNAPDSVYFRQAHSIQELARKKFQRIRLTRKELTRSEPKNLTASHADVTPASNGDVSNDVTVLPENFPPPPVGFSGNMEGRLMVEDKFFKGEDFSVKDRRSTYTNSVDPDFSLFDQDQRRLVPLGLEGSQYSYARSLARFAGPLGPVVWKIASRRIKQSLPPEVGFGPGWVGDYEPPLQGPYIFDMSKTQRETSQAHFMNDVSPNVQGGPGLRWLQKPTAPAQPKFSQTVDFSQNGQQVLADGRFGQMAAVRGFGQNPVSHFDPRVFAGGRFGQHPGENDNLVPRVFADGRFGQISHSGAFQSHPRTSYDQSMGNPNLQASLTKSTVHAENPNFQVRGNPIDAVTTAAPTRMSVGRVLPPPVGRSMGEEGGYQRVNPNPNPNGFQFQAPWQGLIPHWQERKNESRAPDLNVDFQSPKLPVLQVPGACVDPPQPDLALQL